MSEPLLHNSTANAARQVVANPVHAIGIEAPKGAGKKFLSKYITGEILLLDRVDNNPYVRMVDCSGNIGIDDIRDLIKFLSLKIPGEKKFKRCLIFWSFENLSHEGQNALLKSLEEPPQDTLIIITTDSKNKLLPTTVSRVSWINIVPVSREDSLDYFAGRYTETQIKKVYIISGGKVGLTHELLDDYDNNPLVKAIDLSKSLLAKDKFEQVAQIDSLIKSKDFDMQIYLQALSKILYAAMKNQINKSGTINRKLLGCLEKIARAQNAQKYNSNQKLVMTDLFYNL
jgi:DNA polymerase-3 subunit delta'